VEPPRPDVPHRATLTAQRPALAAAATALALSSHGNVLLLAALLALVAARPAPGVAAVLAAGSAVVRWGSPSLGAIAGAQSVLGPAVTVGPSAAAASAACAAVAIVLCARAPGRGRALLVAIPFGCAAAALAAGPGPGGELALRAAATVVASALAIAIALLAQRVAADRALGALAVAAGVAAVTCAVLA
jgi:hypothetical protein